MIDINELAAFAYAQVTSISERVFKRRQEPQIRIASNYSLTRQARVLGDTAPVMAEGNLPVVLQKQATLQVMPGSGATVVRSLDATTAITVLRKEGAYALVASEGRPLGYVAVKDLMPVQ